MNSIYECTKHMTIHKYFILGTLFLRFRVRNTLIRKYSGAMRVWLFTDYIHYLFKYSVHYVYYSGDVVYFDVCGITKIHYNNID